MPLHTWLAGDYRTTWGGEASAPPRRRSIDDAVRLREDLRSALEPLIGRRPEWCEEGPPQAALALGSHSFSLPFLLARRWSYRLKLPNLGALEGTQLWIPELFESAFRLLPPWSDEDTLMVASLPRVTSELDRLREGMQDEEAIDMPEVRDGFQVAGRLLAVAARAAEVSMPVIVEG